MRRRLNHVGISVRNLQRSIAFYRDMLGMQVVGEGDFSGEQYEQILALPQVRGRAAMLECDGLRIELFEFVTPDPGRADPARPVSDHGISHFCIEVAEVAPLYERLRACGVSFHCPPLRFGGARATYGRDPDGNVFELLQIQDPA